MSDLIPHEPKIEKIERFQALQAGHYWRALVNIPEHAIERDETLLLVSLKWVDNAPHTIVMRAHPSKYDKQVKVVVPKDDGSTRETWVRCGEHEFLLRDFLRSFEFEENHEEIRAREIQAVQGRVQELQRELVEGQRDQQFMEAIAHEKLAEAEAAELRRSGANDDQIQEALVQLGADQSRSLALVSGSVADAIGTGITTEAIEELRVSVQREGKLAQYKADWITQKSSEIAKTIQAVTPFYQELAAAALAGSEDIRSYVVKLLQGIESLDLYVGKDVIVETICKGASAPRSEPLTFVQKKLLVDEELAIWAELDEWFDFSKLDLFFEALENYESLVDQIFPTERCALVMATTRRHIDYGNVATNMVCNAKNASVFIMVRDGGNIYRVISPVESHLGTARLFPSLDDQEAIFRGMDGSEIKFDDVRYTKHLESHEAYAIHFKRLLILFCGLDHRLRLFGDFYDGPQDLGFVTLKFQETYCRFLHDDDGTGLLGDGNSMPSLDAWIADKNEYLRSGSRVLCRWAAVMNPDTAPGACKEYRSYYPGEGFDRRYSPSSDRDIVIAYREGESICVSIEVSRSDRKFMCKVNLSALSSSRWGRSTQLEYLCLDAVSPEELHYYIHSRRARQDQVMYIRIFKEALQRLQAERAHERNSRRKLLEALEAGKIASGNSAQQVINQAVIAWRAKNRGASLPDFSGTTAPKGWKQLLDQMYVLAGKGQKQVESIEAFVLGLGYTPLRLVLSGSAKVLVYAAPTPAERDDRLEEHAWVHLIEVASKASGISEASRRWALLPTAAASETLMHEWSTATAWAGKTSMFKSHGHKQTVFDFAEQGAQRLKTIRQPLQKEVFSKLLEQWADARRDASSQVRELINPIFTTPIGVVRLAYGGFAYLCATRDTAMGLLQSTAPDAEQMELLARIVAAGYRNKERVPELIQSEVKRENPWSLMLVAENLRSSPYGPFTERRLDVAFETLEERDKLRPSLDAWLQRYTQRYGKRGLALWMAPELTSESGTTLDAVVDVKLPENYAPTAVRKVYYDVDGGEARRVCFDIYPADIEPPALWTQGQKHMSCSSYGESFQTLDEAYQYMARSKQPGWKWKRSTEIKHSPAVPEGVTERWQMVPEAE